MAFFRVIYDENHYVERGDMVADTEDDDAIKLSHYNF